MATKDKKDDINKKMKKQNEKDLENEMPVDIEDAESGKKNEKGSR